MSCVFDSGAAAFHSLWQSSSNYVRREIKFSMQGLLQGLFSAKISEFQWLCHIVPSTMPADDDNSWLKEEKHPNQIKSRNRCCLELNTFQRLLSKGIMALFILHVSRPAQPLPLPQATYDGWCGGWLWNGLTYSTCSTPEMKFTFRAVFVPLPHFVLPSLAF